MVEQDRHTLMDKLFGEIGFFPRHRQRHLFRRLHLDAPGWRHDG
jgi:hypothetical protein